MKRFLVNVTIQNEPVTLTVEAMDAAAEHSIFKVRKGKKWLAVINMNGECNLVSSRKQSLTEEAIKRLCHEISLHLKRSNADLSIIHL
jgi:hypothetical protein